VHLGLQSLISTPRGCSEFGLTISLCLISRLEGASMNPWFDCHNQHHVFALFVVMSSRSTSNTPAGEPNAKNWGSEAREAWVVGEQTVLGTMSTRAFHRRPLDLFAGNQESVKAMHLWCFWISQRVMEQNGLANRIIEPAPCRRLFRTAVVPWQIGQWSGLPRK
jgi:hypothetical protein